MGGLKGEKVELSEHVILLYSQVSKVLQLFIKDLWHYVSTGLNSIDDNPLCLP